MSNSITSWSGAHILLAIQCTMVKILTVISSVFLETPLILHKDTSEWAAVLKCHFGIHAEYYDASFNTGLFLKL